MIEGAKLKVVFEMNVQNSADRMQLLLTRLKGELRSWKTLH